MGSRRCRARGHLVVPDAPHNDHRHAGESAKQAHQHEQGAEAPVRPASATRPCPVLASPPPLVLAGRVGPAPPARRRAGGPWRDMHGGRGRLSGGLGAQAASRLSAAGRPRTRRSPAQPRLVRSWCRRHGGELFDFAGRARSLRLRRLVCQTPASLPPNTTRPGRPIFAVGRLSSPFQGRTAPPTLPGSSSLTATSLASNRPGKVSTARPEPCPPSPAVTSPRS